MIQPEDDMPSVTPSVAPGWMITFADLLSLLLAFFVLMFATTSIAPKDWQRTVQPISTYLSGQTIAAPEVSAPPPAGPPRIELDYTAALFERLAVNSAALKGAAVERDEHEIRFRLPMNFAWAGQDPAPLADLARLLSSLDNRIEVRVHGVADLTQAADPLAQWRRVLARADAVSAELERMGVRKLPVSGAVDLEGKVRDEQVTLIIRDEANDRDGTHAAAP